MHAATHKPSPPGATLENGRDLLRFITCGSVDDGKSTLIGRMLYDAQLVFDDHLAALRSDSARYGAAGHGEIDFALLVDGLEAEREQGITIDVAYRFFGTPRRSFIVADTPGHEQYTRNMATGASNAELAVILVDARKGVLTQTKRHSYICSTFGIKHAVLAVNKMDLVHYSEAVFARIVDDFRTFTRDLAFRAIVAIPLSARHGDNVTTPSEKMGWYRGKTLLDHLETVDTRSDDEQKPFRFPVAWINRPDADFRGLSGTVVSGAISQGERIVVAASGRQSSIARIVTYDGDAPQASAGEAVTLTLTDEIDVGRGDVLAKPEEMRPEIADQFAAHILWMDEEPLLPGRSYWLKAGTKTVAGQITALKYKVDVNTLAHEAARTLKLNEIGFCNIATSAPIAVDPFRSNADTGCFILVDRYTNATAGAGTISFALRRAGNLPLQAFSVDKLARAALLKQRPCIVWFTGFSGSGKSTIANEVERLLHARGIATYALDGDNVRHGLNRDLGFTDADRVENIRRVGEVAKLFVEAGLVVLCSFISPFAAERQMVRDLVAPGEFLEVFVDTPIEECIRRDPKGLYARAREGRLKNFTGIDSAYEPPQSPELVLRTSDRTPPELAAEVVASLERLQEQP
jgi:bifunctional enzyme CysN/CysC